METKQILENQKLSYDDFSIDLGIFEKEEEKEYSFFEPEEDFMRMREDEEEFILN